MMRNVCNLIIVPVKLVSNYNKEVWEIIKQVSSNISAVLIRYSANVVRYSRTVYSASYIGCIPRRPSSGAGSLASLHWHPSLRPRLQVPRHPRQWPAGGHPRGQDGRLRQTKHLHELSVQRSNMDQPQSQDSKLVKLSSPVPSKMDIQDRIHPQHVSGNFRIVVSVR